MINEEKKINEIFGKENHFAVPQGYFDTLADQIMAKIPMPEAEPLAVTEPLAAAPRMLEKAAQVVPLRIWQRMPLRKIAAVVGVAALLGGGVLLGLQQGEQNHVPLAQTHPSAMEGVHAADSEDATFDQMADYTMMDSQDFYAQLADY